MSQLFFRFFVLLLLMSILACSVERDGQGNSRVDSFFKSLIGGKKRTIPVTVANVHLQERSIKLNVPGKLIPSERTVVRAPHEVRIDRVFADTGETIEAGNPLIRFSEDETTIQLAAKRAELREKQANLEKNNYFFRNRDRLFDEGRLDRNQYDNLETEIDELEGAIERLQNEIRSFEAKLEQTTIASPITGLIEEKNADAGILVTANDPIVTLVRIDPMQVEFQLAAHEASAIRQGQPVTVRLIDLPGEIISGQVTSIASALDAEAKTFTVRASFGNLANIYKVGMPAEVEFQSSQKQRYFLVPADAIITDRRQYFVFTVVKGVAHKVQIVPRETQGRYTEIVRGLREDDLIVIKGHERLEEGTPVDIWGK